MDVESGLKVSLYILCLGAGLIVGCVNRGAQTSVVSEAAMRELIGQQVTLVGRARPRKIGAALQGKDFYVWIEGLHDWTEEFSGKQVEVVGILEERHDLPLFVADTTEERGELQGIPVPSGTDLHEASRRFVLRDAKWKLK